MFRKLLKYDMRPMLRLWLILTAAALGLSVMGGLCTRGIEMATTDPMKAAFIPFSMMGMMMSIFGIVAYVAAISVILLVRFYRNFFTDEGYLTFTLPVKRSALFNARLFSAMVFNTATFAVLIVCIVIILAIAPGGVNGESSALRAVLNGIRLMLISLAPILTEAIAGWVTAYIIAFLLLTLAAYAFSTLLMFCCVIFGSIIVKKLKFLMAIGLYYAVTVAIEILSYLLTLVGTLGIQAISSNPAMITDGEFAWLFLLLIIGAAMVIGVASCFLYKFAVSKLRGNLNLA